MAKKLAASPTEPKVDESEVKAPKCPVTRQEFREFAVPLTFGITGIAGAKLIANVKEFSTGSLGFFSNEKIILVINGKPMKAQLSLSIVLTGSKELGE